MKAGKIGILCAITSGALLLAGCEASSISAPLGPSLGSAVPTQGPKTLDQRLYEAGAKYLGTYNTEENHKAMSCGEGYGRIGCNWAHRIPIFPAFICPPVAFPGRKASMAAGVTHYPFG
jgi:hypothetical protein